MCASSLLTLTVVRMNKKGSCCVQFQYMYEKMNILSIHIFQANIMLCELSYINKISSFDYKKNIKKLHTFKQKLNKYNFIGITFKT